VKITIEPTSELIEAGPFMARKWAGTAEDGTRLHALILVVAVHVDGDQSAFERELISLGEAAIHTAQGGTVS